MRERHDSQRMLRAKVLKIYDESSRVITDSAVIILYTCAANIQAYIYSVIVVIASEKSVSLPRERGREKGGERERVHIRIPSPIGLNGWNLPVKQGCPLSPTLFGIVDDNLYFRMMSRVLR